MVLNAAELAQQLHLLKKIHSPELDWNRTQDRLTPLHKKNVLDTCLSVSADRGKCNGCHCETELEEVSRLEREHLRTSDDRRH